MKSLNLRFVEVHIKAMNDLVNAGLYGSIADVVRAAVRDLLSKEYFGREAEIEHMIALRGSRKETYGQGDRAKGYKASERIKKEIKTISVETEKSAEPSSIGIGGSSPSISTPTIVDDKEGV